MHPKFLFPANVVTGVWSRAKRQPLGVEKFRVNPCCESLHAAVDSCLRGPSMLRQGCLPWRAFCCAMPLPKNVRAAAPVRPAPWAASCIRQQFCKHGGHVVGLRLVGPCASLPSRTTHVRGPHGQTGYRDGCGYSNRQLLSPRFRGSHERVKPKFPPLPDFFETKRNLKQAAMNVWLVFL